MGLDLVDFVPRYPANEDGRDERAVYLADLADLALDIVAQPSTQTHRTDARAPIFCTNCTNCTSWGNNRHGC